MTDPMDEIREQINNCQWRKDICGVPVCTGYVAPCEKIIDEGKCDTLKEYFKQEGGNSNDMGKS